MISKQRGFRSVIPFTIDTMPGVRMLSCDADWALERRCVETVPVVYYPEGYGKYETFSSPAIRQHTVIDFCSYAKDSELPQKTTRQVLTFNFHSFASTCALVCTNDMDRHELRRIGGDLFVERFMSSATSDTPQEMLIVQQTKQYAHQQIHMPRPACSEIKDVGRFACGEGEAISVNTLHYNNGERRSLLTLYKNLYMRFYKPLSSEATYEVFRTLSLADTLSPRFAELFELDPERSGCIWPLVYSPMTKRVEGFMRLPAFLERNALSRTVVSILPYELAFWDEDETDTAEDDTEDE